MILTFTLRIETPHENMVPYLLHLLRNKTIHYAEVKSVIHENWMGEIETKNGDFMDYEGWKCGEFDL